MNPKISIATNLFDAKTRRSCLRLLIAIAILCWGSMARAQQSERWIGAATGTQTWTNIAGWTPQGVSSNGDALTFGSQSLITPAADMAPQNNFPTTIINTTLHTTNQFGISSITFNTNGFILGGNALQITNGVTDNYGTNTNGIAMTLGASQNIVNNSTLIGTNANYFTNTESAGIDLGTNTLTVGGSAPVFFTSILKSTNGGQLVVNNSSICRLGVTNIYGTNVIQITNLFTGNGTYTATTNIYTNVFAVVGAGGYTNYFPFTNIVSSTNGTTTYYTNYYAQVQDALKVLGGTAQLNSVVVGANGGALLLPNGANVGNISLDGTLDLNGQSPTLNGLEDSGLFSGVVDNISAANTGLYTLTLGNANSNGVFSGVIQNTAGTVALTKTGFGKETLQNINLYKGPTLINQGTLVVVSGATLGINSTTLTIASGAVLDVSGLNPGGYVPYGAGALTVAAGTPTKPYTNFLGSYDPYWPTYSVSKTGTNNVLTFQTNVVAGVSTNVVTTTNFASFSFSTNSIISIINADVVGNFTVNGGGAISPITSISPGIATWAIQGNLTLDSSFVGALNRVNFLLNNTTATGGGTNDLIAVSGTLSVGDELDFVITPVTGTLTAGTYTLMTSAHYVGTSPNNGHAAVLKLVEARGLSGDTVQASGNNITLTSFGGTATPGNIFWRGTPANNNWDVHLTQNWQFNGTNDYFYPGDNVNFGDTGVGTIVMPVVVSPGSMTFNNNKTNYTFAQGQSTFVTGPGGLVKNGSGTVTLQNPNAFTGDVTVNGGTLSCGYYNTATNQHTLYNGVPAGNLILGGGTMNLNETQVNSDPEADFQNVTINPGASAITQSARTAGSTPIYVISNNVTRAVGGTLNLVMQTAPASGVATDNGGHCGIFFVNTNAQGYYGVNGILGGYATFALNDWVTANNTNTGSHAFAEYQTDLNPANWGSTSNVSVSSALSGNIPTKTINSLKFNPNAVYAVNINPGQTLTLSSGGLLVPNAITPYQVVLAGGLLQGPKNADLILLNNNVTPGSSLLIQSTIQDNTDPGPCALTTAGGGLTILTGNNTYTGPTYINNGYNGAAPGTLQIGANGTSGSIASSSAIIDNGTLAFSRSDNTSVGAISGTGSLAKLGGGVLTLTTNNSLSGLVTISAGTLQLGTGGPAGSVSNTTAIINNGTLVFNNNNTVGYPNLISGYGNVVQFGSGNLIIATNETYSGNTVVSNGTLTLTASGSISNTASITVNAGALLDVSAVSSGLALRSAAPPEVLMGSGTVNGSVTTATGTTLEPIPGSGAFGTLTISGNLNMAGGNFRFDVGNGNGNHDLISVGGVLAMNSGTFIINVTGGPLANGVYPLIHAAGGFASGSSTANLGLFGFVQSGQIAVLINDTPNNNLDLLVFTGDITALTWVGDGSGNVWNVNGVANWDAGAGAVVYQNPDYTVFNDTGSASPAINITGIVSPTSVTNNSITKNYTLGIPGGAGKISGGAQLVQNGTSQLTVQAVNDYLGGTRINAGVVQLGNNAAANADGMIGGNGSIYLASGATLSVSNFAAETINGAISGSGLLMQSGVGKLILAGNNSAFSGPISAANTLQMGNGFTGTLGTGNETNNNGLIFNVGPTPASIVAVNANISGSGGITNIGPGIVTLTGSNTFSGTTLLNSGTIRLGSANAMLGSAGIFMDNASNAVPVGTLDLNGYNLTVPYVQPTPQGFNSGNVMPTPVVPMILNNGTGTSTLTLNSGTTFTNVAELLDNNNGGTGKLALLVANNTFLYLFSVWNNLLITPYPNLFSGGMTISNATVVLGQNASSSSPGNLGTAAAGTGPITLEGGLGTVTNGNSRFPTNGTLYANGATGSSSGTLGTTIGILNVPTGQFGTVFLPQRGTFSSTLQGGGTLIVEPNYVRGQLGGDWSGFTGTIIFESIAYTGSSGSGFTMNQPLGYPNATLFMQTNNSAGNVSISGGAGGPVFPIGALTGGDNTSLIGGGTQGNGASGGAANTIWAIGGLNLSTTNGSQIVDGGCGIRKVGTGLLMLTNNTLSFGGQLVVSNGTLAFAPTPGAITNFDYPNTANYLVGSNITIVSPGILDVTAASTNSTLWLGHNGAQTLFGNGTLNGNLRVTNSTVAPGYRASDPTIYSGSHLTVNGTATINFGSTLLMSINSTASPAYDSLASSGTLTINSTALVVTNAPGGLAFPGGTSNVFRFFAASVPANTIGSVSTVGITNIYLPALPAGMFWVTNLTVDGSMAIVNTNAAVVINPNRPPVQVTVNGNQLKLGWPTNLGWILQAQTNPASIGLSNNWVDVAGSATQTNAVITINPNSPSVFYRLRSPP